MWRELAWFAGTQRIVFDDLFKYEDGGNGVGIKGLKGFVNTISECLETSLPNAIVQKVICELSSST